MLRGFLIRLTALDGQLEDNRGMNIIPSIYPSLASDLKISGETTFAVIVETTDNLEPLSNTPSDGVSLP